MSTVNYQAGASNVNRQVTFRIQPTAAGDANSAMFAFLKGVDNNTPLVGAQTSAPTANQLLAQLRTNKVMEALRHHAVIVGARLVDDSNGTGGLTANYGPALEVTFETDDKGTFQVAGWESNPTSAKQSPADITDTLGIGGSIFVKTKPGLQSSLDALKDVSYDGGTTGPFGTLSASGNIVLDDGTTTAGAPKLSTPGAGSGLTITFVR